MNTKTLLCAALCCVMLCGCSENSSSALDPTVLAVSADHVTASAGQQNVPVTVSVANNPGFTSSGIRIIYDEGLTPVYDAASKEAELTMGPAGNGLIGIAMVATDKRIVGFGSMGTNDNQSDGAIFTCYFNVPADAKSGKVYDIQIEVVDFIRSSGTELSPVSVSGSITVQ